jgi:hypothetical protein
MRHIVAVLSKFRLIFVVIQGVPGGKVNILGGHNTGHSKQKSLYMYMCPIPNGFRDRAISLYISKLLITKTLCALSSIGTYCSSDKVGIIYFRKFHRQYQCTLQLV